MELIADEGTKGLSIRSVAARLGGSITLVTHYYQSRSALLLDLVTQLSATWRVELQELQSHTHSPADSVSMLLKWLLPLDAESQAEEHARIQILATKDEPACLDVLLRFDEAIRAELRTQLVQLAAEDDVESTIDVLRATTDGISLAYQTNALAWPPERQLATLSIALRRVLDIDTSVVPEWDEPAVLSVH
ncbi:TetR/AcrR family transcriptional regulator [Microbacterium sp. ISL-103]|uniref:TetR/AcrR family transcriptional regulator n=1 Tax=Microbacterium sp. ISL-103 TaxID=2819156 RepID=UPI001BE8C196|nr:TetR family transcriptional regulator C-terminal domain-containing protein [Microbacterium sp. ISL-103]MBT2475820.1 TetR/AcrR family transcriptional regulator [Microbacterium sp. ISL-103]